MTFNHVFSLDANHLSALGSLLSAGATIFAAFTAYWLYNDWRDPHQATFYANECKSIINFYKNLLLLQRKLSLQEKEIEKIISKENGVDKKQPTFLSSTEKSKLRELNKQVNLNISELFDVLDRMSSELIMLAYLTQDPEYMVDSINLESSLTKSYIKPFEENNEGTPYAKFNELQKANRNNFLIVQGAELITRIKKLGKI